MPETRSYLLVKYDMKLRSSPNFAKCGLLAESPIFQVHVSEGYKHPGAQTPYAYSKIWHGIELLFAIRQENGLNQAHRIDIAIGNDMHGMRNPIWLMSLEEGCGQQLHTQKQLLAQTCTQVDQAFSTFELSAGLTVRQSIPWRYPQCN